MRTTKQTIISAAFGLLLLGSPALGDDTCRLGGMWRLVSFHSEDVVTKARVNVFGERPRGYLTMGCNGGFDAWAKNAQPMPVLSIWEDVAQSMSGPTPPLHAIYYSGIYHLNAKHIIMRIDNVRHDGWSAYNAADLTWNERQSQTNEVRNFRVEPTGLDNEILVIETAPIPNPDGVGNAIIGRTVWERVSDWQYAPPN